MEFSTKKEQSDRHLIALIEHFVKHFSPSVYHTESDLAIEIQGGIH